MRFPITGGPIGPGGSAAPRTVRVSIRTSFRLARSLTILTPPEVTFDKRRSVLYTTSMDHDNHFDDRFKDHERLSAFERQLKDFAERIRENRGRFDVGELNDLPEEDRKFLLRLLAIGAGLGVGALGLYLGKRAAEGVAQTDLADVLRHIEGLPAEIVERIRAGWNGMARREQRIIIPDE